jgi:prefoldin subunit 5
MIMKKEMHTIRLHISKMKEDIDDIKSTMERILMEIERWNKEQNQKMK